VTVTVIFKINIVSIPTVVSPSTSIKLFRDNAAKLKLGRLSSAVVHDDEDVFAGPFGQRQNNNKPSNWKFAVVGCGSNAFGQIFVDGTMYFDVFYLL
jgi:hypothetical protein